MEQLIQPIRQISLADAMQQWSEIRGQAQERKLREMQMQRAEENAPIDSQLKQAQMAHYQGQIKRDESQAQLEEAKAQKEKHLLVGGMASTIEQRMKPFLGLQQADPQAFQAKLDEIGAPFRAPIAQVMGTPVDPNKPIDWNALQSLSTFHGSGGQEYHPPVGTNQGTLQYGANGWEPIKINGQVAMPVAGDVQLQANLAAAREGQKVVQGEDDQGRKFHAPAYATNPAFQNRTGAPQPEPQNIQLLMQMANGGDKAAAVELDRIQSQQQVVNQPAQPVLGPSISDAETQKATAKNQADLLQEKSKQQQEHAIDAKSANNILDQAEPLLKESTNSGIGSLIDETMGFLGQSTKGADAAEALKVLGARLTVSMPKMSGPQSDKDAQLYKEEAGQLGNPRIPLSRKMRALAVIRNLNDYYIGQGDSLSSSEAAELAALKARFGEK